MTHKPLTQEGEAELALQDLIWQRERLNAELLRELDRAERIAVATSRLKDLNNSAQNIVAEALQRLGVWPAPVDPAQPFSIPQSVNPAHYPYRAN